MDEEKPQGGAQEIVRLTKTGVSLCQTGRWQQGLQYLDHAVRTGDSGSLRVPARGLACLGYGKVRFLRQRQEGLALCKRAVEADFFDPETYVFLAKAELFIGDRASAVATVQRGLKAVPDSEGLVKLQGTLGQRRKPVLGFLPRSHPANKFLGLMRHHFTTRS